MAILVMLLEQYLFIDVTIAYCHNSYVIYSCIVILNVKI